MNCNSYNEITNCGMSIGGVKRVTIFPFGSVYNYTYTNDDLSKITGYEITTLGVDVKTLPNSLLDESLERGGTDVYTHNLSVSIAKLDASKRKELFKLLRGKLTIFVTDNNNNCWIIGKNTPVKASSFDQTTDQDGGDSIYNIVFTGFDKEPFKAITCYDGLCAISVQGNEYRQSLLTIDDASTYDFSGLYELLGDDITRSITPLFPFEPLDWTTPATYYLSTPNYDPSVGAAGNHTYDSGDGRGVS